MVARTAASAFLSVLVIGAGAFAQDDSRASGPSALVSEIADWVAAVESDKESARTDEGDATLYDCLMDKWINMTAYEVLANEAYARYQSAGDEAAREDAMDLVQTAHGRVFALKAEADQCESDVINYAGPQDRTAERNPNIPDQDTTNTGTATSPTGGMDTTDDSDQRNTPVL